MKILSILFLFLISFSVYSAPGDYCLGEWPEKNDDYCQRVMAYVTTLSIDRNVGREKSLVYLEIPQAVTHYCVPAELASNFIEYIWQFPPRKNKPQDNVNMLFGECINNAETLLKKGCAEADIILNGQEMD